MGAALLAGWLRAGARPFTRRSCRTRRPRRRPGASRASWLAAPRHSAVRRSGGRRLGGEAAIMDDVLAELALGHRRRHAGDFRRCWAGRWQPRPSSPAGTPSCARCRTRRRVGQRDDGRFRQRLGSAARWNSATKLLEAVGTCSGSTMRLIDAVTALSGSGPAYVFLLAECLAEAGRDAGLDAELAAQLARATVAGAGELLRRSDLSPAELRQNVTSPRERRLQRWKCSWVRMAGRSPERAVKAAAANDPANSPPNRTPAGNPRSLDRAQGAALYSGEGVTPCSRNSVTETEPFAPRSSLPQKRGWNEVTFPPSPTGRD